MTQNVIIHFALLLQTNNCTQLTFNHYTNNQSYDLTKNK